MIQRIQTIYLFLAGVMAAVFSFISDYALTQLQNLDLLKVSSSLSLIVSAIIALVTIFLFKNRSLQIKLIWLSIIVALAGVVLYIYTDGVQNFYLDWQFYLILVVILFLFLAKKGVQKDENLIKSSYRLR
ncbi:MAG: DUF4293 domain-containing protein [Chitinophagales bacterium]|nr:DUF4293 domain-containing protein [Chitinophagales bacterium]